MSLRPLSERPGAAAGSPPGPYLPATTHAYLARASQSLLEAARARTLAERYASAHVSALRATAAFLAARAAPAPGRGARQKNAWVLLAEVAPELQEWASFFAAGAAKRAAAEAGSSRSISEREADDLVREADRFLTVIEQALGLAAHPALPAELARAVG